MTAAQIRTRIKEVLEDLLNSDINKAEKLALLNRNVLGDQYVRQLTIAAFREILKFIEDNSKEAARKEASQLNVPRIGIRFPVQRDGYGLGRVDDPFDVPGRHLSAQ